MTEDIQKISSKISDINPTSSVITVNLNELNIPTKRQDCQNELKIHDPIT